MFGFKKKEPIKETLFDYYNYWFNIIFAERLSKLQEGIESVQVNANKRMDAIGISLNEKIIYKNNNFVECEKCGCLLNKKTAFRGESTIEKKTIPEYIVGFTPNGKITEPAKTVEYIKENHYCKIHKTK